MNMMTINQHVNKFVESCLRDGVCLSDGEIDIIHKHIVALCTEMMEGSRQKELANRAN